MAAAGEVHVAARLGPRARVDRDSAGDAARLVAKRPGPWPTAMRDAVVVDVVSLDWSALRDAEPCCCTSSAANRYALFARMLQRRPRPKPMACITPPDLKPPGPGAANEVVRRSNSGVEKRNTEGSMALRVICKGGCGDM